MMYWWVDLALGHYGRKSWEENLILGGTIVASAGGFLPDSDSIHPHRPHAYELVQSYVPSSARAERASDRSVSHATPLPFVSPMGSLGLPQHGQTVVARRLQVP